MAFHFYTENGFIDMARIIDLPVPFVWVLGGRGTGKTYGALKELYYRGDKFMFMRRTQSQIDLINKPEFSPFKSLQNDGIAAGVSCHPISKYNSGFYENYGTPEQEIIGYTCALSTISNMRGFDASDTKILLYDEFIPERHERPIKGEAAAFLNCYESINRNRELKGEPPLKFVGLSNANDLGCPLLDGLNMIDTLDKMIRKGKELVIDRERGFAVVMLMDSPISLGKRNTALYKMVGEGEFSAMSLGNEFSANDYSEVARRPIKEYVSMCVYDDICIYRHKSRREYYVSRTITGDPPRYKTTPNERAAFKKAYKFLLISMYCGAVFYEDYYCKNRLNSVLSLA